MLIQLLSYIIDSLFIVSLYAEHIANFNMYSSERMQSENTMTRM